MTDETDAKANVVRLPTRKQKRPGRAVVGIPIDPTSLPIMPEVEEMFRAATKRGPCPTVEQLVPFALALSSFDGNFQPWKPKQDPKAVKLREAAKLVLDAIQSDMAHAVEGHEQALKSNEPWREPMMKRMQERISALEATEMTARWWIRWRWLDAPAKKGAPNRSSWYSLAEDFAGLARKAWNEAGHAQLSAKADGPLVKVVCIALRRATGNGFSPENVAMALRRAKAR